MVSELAWLFVTVTVCVVLVVPTATLPKLKFVGETVTGAVPAPESVTVSGLFGAFVATLSEVGATAPREAGVSVNMMVQLEPAASVVPHVPPEMV
jgi:hypothetical protein